MLYLCYPDVMTPFRWRFVPFFLKKIYSIPQSKKSTGNQYYLDLRINRELVTAWLAACAIERKLGIIFSSFFFNTSDPNFRFDIWNFPIRNFLFLKFRRLEDLTLETLILLLRRTIGGEGGGGRRDGPRFRRRLAGRKQVDGRVGGAAAAAAPLLVAVAEGLPHAGLRRRRRRRGRRLPVLRLRVVVGRDGPRARRLAPPLPPRLLLLRGHHRPGPPPPRLLAAVRAGVPAAAGRRRGGCWRLSVWLQATGTHCICSRDPVSLAFRVNRIKIWRSDLVAKKSRLITDVL